jgi:hypothetical protein
MECQFPPTRQGSDLWSLRKAVVFAQGAQPTQAMFQVCQSRRESRWIVTLGTIIYGAYIDKEQALLDAADAARDSLEAGCEAQVWIRERSNVSRVF